MLHCITSHINNGRCVLSWLLLVSISSYEAKGGKECEPSHGFQCFGEAIHTHSMIVATNVSERSGMLYSVVAWALLWGNWW